MDRLEKDKKKRFKIKYDVENFFRNKAISEDLKKEMFKNPILSYNRYKNIDDRGYNIISIENQEKTNLEGMRIKHKDTGWDTIKENADGKDNFFK